jgi:peptidoglycan/LPS O-acetylase OafA/YrhL
MRFNPALHGLRGIAAMAVLIFHWDQFSPTLMDSLSNVSLLGTSWDLGMQVGFGWLGVPLFFVLSGYLLSVGLRDQDLDRRSIPYFYFRRIMRIYPPVLLQLLIILVLAKTLPGLYSIPSLSHVLANAALWINVPGSMVPPINLVWWTLPIELGFYLILPAMVWVSRRISWLWILCAAYVVAIGWRTWVFRTHEVENYLAVLPLMDFLPGTVSSFTLGAFIGSLPQPKAGSLRLLGLVLSMAALLALQYWQLSLADVYWHGHWILVVWVPMVAAAIAGIVYFSISPWGPTRLLSCRPLTWLGDVSYGIYLWHFPILVLMRYFAPDLGATNLGSLALLVIVTMVTIIAAALSFYGVERYAMRIGR